MSDQRLVAIIIWLPMIILWIGGAVWLAREQARVDAAYERWKAQRLAHYPNAAYVDISWERYRLERNAAAQKAIQK